jgi:hypothetical protein
MTKRRWLFATAFQLTSYVKLTASLLPSSR